MTQEQLAALGGVDVRTIRNAEESRRKLDVRTVAKIATALGREFGELIRPANAAQDACQSHLDVVRRWHRAVLAADISTLLSLPAHNIRFEILGADGILAGGGHQGCDALNSFLLDFFQRFRIASVRRHDYRIHAVDTLVFLRTTARMKSLPCGKPQSVRQFDEFEFRDNLICRWVNIADWGPMRKAVQ
jgi:transcriptional regulator with XRE-family HTH domain